MKIKIDESTLPKHGERVLITYRGNKSVAIYHYHAASNLMFFQLDKGMRIPAAHVQNWEPLDPEKPFNNQCVRFQLLDDEAWLYGEFRDDTFIQRKLNGRVIRRFDVCMVSKWEPQDMIAKPEKPPVYAARLDVLIARTNPPHCFEVCLVYSNGEFFTRAFSLDEEFKRHSIDLAERP